MYFNKKKKKIEKQKKEKTYELPGIRCIGFQTSLFPLYTQGFTEGTYTEWNVDEKRANVWHSSIIR